jgi:hypothetical protein
VLGVLRRRRRHSCASSFCQLCKENPENQSNAKQFGPHNSWDRLRDIEPHNLLPNRQHADTAS